MKRLLLSWVKLIAGATCLTAFLCGSAPAAQVFSLTNKIWRYEQERNMDGTGWQTPAFSDLDWYAGPGLFGFDGNPQIEPLIQTRLTVAGTPSVQFYRLRVP